MPYPLPSHHDQGAGSESAESALPTRDLSDPKALRALAHPLRIRLLEELVVAGPATATQLAERVGESPANCSWHLRMLARFGFVEEVGTVGRRRPWRFVPAANRWSTTQAEAEVAVAAEAATDLLTDREYRALREWLAASASADARWREVAFVNQAFAWVTPAELKELDEAIQLVLRRFNQRLTDPDTRPADAVPVRLMAWGIPARPVPRP